MSFYLDMPIEELQQTVQNNPFEIDLWLALIKRVAHEDCCENALEEIFIAEDIFPDDIELQAIKALCLMSLGETREAHELLQQSLRRCPGDEVINRVLSEFLPSFEQLSQDDLLNPYAIRENVDSVPFEDSFQERLDSTIDLIRIFNENDGEPENLIEPLERHVRNFPDDINAKLDMARLCHNVGYHEKARRFYKMVIKEDPLCASAFFELATIEPDEDAAIKYSECGLDLYPRFECGRYNYATLLLKQGMLAEGRNEMLRIPADSPYYVIGMEAIANSHGEEGAFDEAVKIQEKVVALSADNVEAWNCYGHFFAQQGDYETALQQFDRVIQLDNEHLDGLHNRALMLGRLGRHEEAAGVIKYALTIEPHSESLLVNLAVELSHSGRNREAIELMESSLIRFPENARMWLNLGSFHYHSGHLASAIECSKKAIVIDPEKGLAWWNIACSHAVQGNRDQCLSALKVCIEKCPEIVDRIDTEESLQRYLNDEAFMALLKN